MRLRLHNTDRDRQTNAAERLDAEALRRLLRECEPAELFDRDVRDRIGQAIARAMFDPANPW